LVEVEAVEADEALSGTLDNGEMRVEDAYVGLISMTDEERKPFIGKKVGDKMSVNVNELFKSESQRAAILGVKAEELAEIKPEFELEITKIRRFAEPELNEEFFKMAFPEGNVKDEKGLDEFIDAQIAGDLKRDSDYLFVQHMREMLVEKAGMKLPEAFLKHWLFVINEGKFSMEEIEKDFAGFLKMYEWSLVQKHYAKELNLEVTEEEALQEAKALAAMQFAQYGMASAPDDMLTNYGRSILENKQEASKIYDKLFESKIVEALRAQIKVSEKKVSTEEFGKIVEKLNA
jgi:trigger factor